MVETDSSNTIAPEEEEILAADEEIEDGCMDSSSVSDNVNDADEVQG